MSSTWLQVGTALAGPAGEPGGTSVSVMKPLNAFLTEEQSSHLWGGLQLSSQLQEEAYGGRREGTPPSWPFLYGGGTGVAGHTHVRSQRYLVLPCSCGISFPSALSPSSPPVVCVKCALCDWLSTPRNVTCRFLMGTDSYMFAITL